MLLKGRTRDRQQRPAYRHIPLVIGIPNPSPVCHTDGICAMAVLAPRARPDGGYA